MPKCKNCGAETENPKFCSHKCSAIVSNINRRKKRFCIYCGKELGENQRKFCCCKCSGDYRAASSDRKSEETGIFSSTYTARTYFLRNKEHVCAICGESVWVGEEIPLIIDHINGNPEDHRMENFRLICPNCDAQLPTYKGRNRGNGRHFRRTRYSEGKSF